MNFARAIYGGAARFFAGFFVFTARTTRAHDFMTEFLQKSYISRRAFLDTLRTAALPRARPPYIQYLIEYYLQARVLVETCGNLIRRRYSAESREKGGGERRRERGERERVRGGGESETAPGTAGYKLDELRSRLTPPFPHPSAKLVEFSAILPPGNLNLVPRRYLPSLLPEIYYSARSHKAEFQMLRLRGNRKADPVNRSFVVMYIKGFSTRLYNAHYALCFLSRLLVIVELYRDPYLC